MATEQYRSMTAHQLVGEIERYINDNSRAHAVEDRWLASHLESLLPTIRQVRSNSLDSITRAQVNAFRAAELEADLERKRKDVEQTERELKKVRAA